MTRPSGGKKNIVGNKSLFKLFVDALLLEIHENLVKEKTLLLDESASQENYKKIFNGKGCSFENYVKHTQQYVKSLKSTITSLKSYDNNFSYKYTNYVFFDVFGNDGSENDVVLNGVADIYS